MLYQDYIEYINSDVWKKKSIDWISIIGECERCGSVHKLTCHHKDYNNLGFERRKDIRVLCWDCHKKYHTVNGERLKTRDFEERLKVSKGNFKSYIKKTHMQNQMKTQFLRKSKIKGISKTKSKKIFKALN